MNKQGQVGVYKLYKLGRLIGTEFNTEIKVLDRDLHVVHHDYAERINEHANISGLWYEYDEKATKLYWAKKPFKNVKEFTDFEEVSETEGISSRKTIEEVDNEIKQANHENLESLKLEYQQLSGKKAHHLWKEDKLIELIDELKK